MYTFSNLPNDSGLWHQASGIQFSSAQWLSHVRLFAAPWTAASQACLSITNSRSLPKLKPIESVMPSNQLILCHTLLLLPSIFPNIRAFSNESVLCIRGPKYWSFSFNISLSNEHPGLISFRMDWLDFLAVQGTLKSLLQHHSSKASILLCSVFFIVQLSHPYMTTGKTIVMTRWTFDKVIILHFNMLSSLVITFLPRTKHLTASWKRKIYIYFFPSWYQLCLFATPWTVAHQALLSLGILQVRILEWVAMPSSRGSSQPRNWTQVSCMAGWLFTVWKKPGKPPFWYKE